MGFVIPNGSFFLGATIARSLGAERGGTVTLPIGRFEWNGSCLRAEPKTMSESSRLYPTPSPCCSCLDRSVKSGGGLPLPDARPGSPGPDSEGPRQSSSGGHRFQVRHLAEARARQRRMTEHFTQFAVPMTPGCRRDLDRPPHDAQRPRASFGDRAVACPGIRLRVRCRSSSAGPYFGIMAAALGGLGTGAAPSMGSGLFLVTWERCPQTGISPNRTADNTCPAAAASFLPSMMAVAQDPADTLRADSPMLSCRQLNRDYCGPNGTLPVLRDLSFEAARGELLVIRGPSGAGKTTLLLTLEECCAPTPAR